MSVYERVYERYTDGKFYLIGFITGAIRATKNVAFTPWELGKQFLVPHKARVRKRRTKP